MKYPVDKLEWFLVLHSRQINCVGQDLKIYLLSARLPASLSLQMHHNQFSNIQGILGGTAIKWSLDVCIYLDVAYALTNAVYPTESTLKHRVFLTSTSKGVFLL